MHPLGNDILLLIGAAGIGCMLLLVLRFKLPAYLALLIVSLGVALAAGIAPDRVVPAVEAGVGKSLGHIALVITLGAMIGRLIEESGSARTTAQTILSHLGPARAPLALVITAFIIGVPTFFEIGVIMLMPIAISVARTARQPLVVFAIPLSITALIVHAMTPPHPGAVATAGLLDVELGRVLIFALPLCAVVTALCVPIAIFLSRRAASRDPSLAGASGAATEAARHDVEASEGPVSAATIFALIALPIALIIGGTIASTALPEGNGTRSLIEFLGNPVTALIIGVIACAYALGVRRGRTAGQIGSALEACLPATAVILLVTGAGGAFAAILVESGIGKAVADTLTSADLPILILAYVLTLFLRAAQGPTTIALITTAGIIGPTIVEAGYSPTQKVLLCLAMGAGGLGLSHVNDAGFWIVTRLIGLNVSQGLRLWTVITTIASLIAFALIGICWSLLS